MVKKGDLVSVHHGYNMLGVVEAVDSENALVWGIGKTFGRDYRNINYFWEVRKKVMELDRLRQAGAYEYLDEIIEWVDDYINDLKKSIKERANKKTMWDKLNREEAEVKLKEFTKLKSLLEIGLKNHPAIKQKKAWSKIKEEGLLNFY